MGYSTPKKPFDLKEFLSQKATKGQSRSGFSSRLLAHKRAQENVEARLRERADKALTSSPTKTAPEG